jgi:glutaminase
VRRIALLDEAIEWSEDQVIYRSGGYTELEKPTQLGDQALLAGLAKEELDQLAALTKVRSFQAGERIVVAGEPASSLFFLESGQVSIKLPSGVRLATLVQGTEFGEMAMIENRRTADVWADTVVRCLELPLDAFSSFCRRYPLTGQQITRNLAILLAKRLIQANTKVDLLTAY